jgi:hypothetical protein
MLATTRAAVPALTAVLPVGTATAIAPGASAARLPARTSSAAPPRGRPVSATSRSG